MKKRLFAGLLSLLMLWTMLPVSALAAGGETESEQPAYFYVLKPERMETPGLGTTETGDFYYVGKGEIINAPAPDETNYKGAKIFIDEAEEEWTFTPPTGNAVKEEAQTITYNDTSYTYVPKDYFDDCDKENKYYIEWYRYSSSAGANSNAPGHSIVNSDTLCWHIDGYPVLSGQYIINYEVKLPEEDHFSPYMENDKHIVQYVEKTADAAFPADDAPRPDSKVYGGVTYTFEGWYTDAACIQEADENTLLSTLDGDGDNQITFYGKYEPETTKVYVYADARFLEENTKTYLTEVLGITLDKNNFFPLGVLSNAELEAATRDATATEDQKKAVKDAAKVEGNFECSGEYKVEVTDNYPLTDVNYNDTTQAVIREWIAAYADGELTGTLSAPMDTKEFGIPKDEGKYNWHLDIKLTDDILPTVTVAPADITIYMGGEAGTAGAVDEEGEIKGSNSLPEPGFTVKLPDGVEADVTKLIFKEKTGNKEWQFVPYDGQTGTNVYKLVPGSGQEATRMQFTNAANETVTSDNFKVGEYVNQTLTMQLYKGSVGGITVEIDGVTYNVNSDTTAKLTVRGTTESEQYATVSTTFDQTTNSDRPGLVAEEGTTYTINDSDVQVQNTAGVSLLFDDIINSTGDDRTELLWDRAQEELDEPTANSEYKYEFKYLDLVDANNGNAWVMASQNVTVYWPLPEGTNSDTDFTLLHFQGLHREMDSEDIGSAIDSCNVEKVDITKVTDTHVQFQIGSGGFSPFVLVWGEATTPDPDPEPDPDPDPNPDPHPGGSTTTYYTLTYESNGGTEYDDERYPRNKVVELDKVPTREGYTFTGWYADEELTKRITEIKMTSDKTVYAGWEATGVPDWLNGDDHFAYVIGYPDGMVKPQNNISRAEVATIFFRLLKPEIRDEYLTQTNQFTDVSGSAWYNTAVSTMAALDIVKGRTPTTFVPDAPITRAEFAAVCARFDTHLRDGDSDFSDISGHWAEAEIERAATLGWINGYPDGTFRPDNAITRAEAMTMINRVLQRLPEDEDDLLPDMNVWPDNQPQDWYYLAVQEATNSHDFDRKDDGVHEHWTDMNADPNWTQYQ